MESADLSKDELTDIIIDAIKENSQVKNLFPNFQDELGHVITNYMIYCLQFKRDFVNGELDTFKRAACLLVAINKSRIVMEKDVRAAIAVDAALKMCEKPYWNVGEHFDEPKKLEEVDFKRDFSKNMEIYNTSRDMLIAALIYEEAGSYLNYYMNLELFYQLALLLKNRPEKINDGDDLPPIQPQERPIKKILSIFKRK